MHAIKAMEYYIPSDRNEVGPTVTGTSEFVEELKQRTFSNVDDILLFMNGEDLTEKYFNESGFTQPIRIINNEGLGLKLPNITKVLDICELIKTDIKEVEVIDVEKQSQRKLTLGDFTEYLSTEPRTSILNMISLEVSNTRLGELVEPPTILQKIDFQHKFWSEPKPGYIPHEPPKVEKYCLISPANAYTDFHVDFSGTSVWYHIVKGIKIFYLIKPTLDNLKLFWAWMESPIRLRTFFADQVDACYKCVLSPGATLFLPTGWIHAVLTVEDALAFGGNFLHIYNMPMQLDVYDMERKLKVDDKYIYPFFQDLHWFVARGLKDELNFFNSQRNILTPIYLIDGLKRLLVSLKQWSTTCTDIQIKFHYPAQLIKDITKEIRFAERRLLTLSPPKPVRESTRVKKKPVYDDFVQYNEISIRRPKKKPIASVNQSSQNSIIDHVPSSSTAVLQQEDSLESKWTVKQGGLKVILSKASVDRSKGNAPYTIKPSPSSEDIENDDADYFEFDDDVKPLEPYHSCSAMQIISKKKIRSTGSGVYDIIDIPVKQEDTVDEDSSKNLDKSVYRIKFKAIQDDKTSKKMWTRVVPDTDDDYNRSIHQDDDFIYPSLDMSDEEDASSPGKKSRLEDDKSWNPKSKVSIALSKSDRPPRVGKTKLAVEKGLEAAAAKKQETIKIIIKKQEKVSLVTDPASSCSRSPKEKVAKPKKGLNTPKQRLGKILKLHKLRR